MEKKLHYRFACSNLLPSFCTRLPFMKCLIWYATPVPRQLGCSINVNKNKMQYFANPTNLYCIHNRTKKTSNVETGNIYHFKKKKNLAFCFSQKLFSNMTWNISWIVWKIVFGAKLFLHIKLVSTLWSLKRRHLGHLWFKTLIQFRSEEASWMRDEMPLQNLEVKVLLPCFQTLKTTMTWIPACMLVP